MRYRGAFKIDKDEWLEELKGMRKYFELFEDRMPQELLQELEDLEKRFV